MASCRWCRPVWAVKWAATRRHAIDGELEWMQPAGRAVSDTAHVLGHGQRAATRTTGGTGSPPCVPPTPRGANMRPQVASRGFGMLMGHQSRMNPFRHRRSYRALMDLPLDQRVRALRDPQTRGTDPRGDARRGRCTVGSINSTATCSSGSSRSETRLDYEPSAEAASPAIAARERSRSVGGHLRHSAARRRQRVSAVPAVELRGRRLRRSARHDVGPDDRAGPR